MSTINIISLINIIKTINKNQELMQEDLKSIILDINKLKGDFNKFKKLFSGYTKTEGNGIELEINENVMLFLNSIYKSSIIKKLNMKTFKDGNTNDRLTELDGIFIITDKILSKSKNKSSNKQYQSLNTPQKINTTKTQNFPENIKQNSRLVIVEAKHNINISQINEKISQLYKFIILLENGISGNTNKKFLKTLQTFKLDNLTEIFLYIGGPTWEDYAVKYLQQINNGTLKRLIWTKDANGKVKMLLTKEEEEKILTILKNHIGIIIPNGTRYNLLTNFLNDDILLNNEQLLYSEHETYKNTANRSNMSYEDIVKSREELNFGGRTKSVLVGLKMKQLPN